MPPNSAAPRRGETPSSAGEGCVLCPRACGAHRAEGERGVCRVDGRMLVARAALHRWEEPVISGQRGSGTVFFSGCPLGCVYCQNAPIAEARAGIEASVADLARMCLSLQGQGALNVSLVTATPFAPQVVQAVACARRAGLDVPVVWNTSGYEAEATLRLLRDTVDVWLPDFKYADADLAARYSHAPDYPQVALRALRAMADQAGSPCFDEVDGAPRMTSGVLVRHMMLPGGLDASKRAVRLLWDEFGNSVGYSLMSQYTPVLASRARAGDGRAARVLQSCPELAGRVAAEEYEVLLDFADRLGIDDYFWQEGDPADESFIPAWDGTGVR
ncbi:radical SAM protein [Eggerthellaceae bacterium zg-997]|nr:radical SAM protein [Eggerthellaceae bacterium zg-997]